METQPTIIRVNDRYYRCLHPTNFKQRSKTPTQNKRIVVDEYEDEEMCYLEDFAVTSEAKNLEEEKFLKPEDDSTIEQQPNNEQDTLNKQIDNKEVKIELFNGQFMVNIYVPNLLRGYLIGKNASNVKQLCDKFKIQIDFPQHKTDEPFVVFGPNKEDVLHAYLKINELLNLKRSQTNLTHFLGVRCDSEEVKINYEKFKDIVKSKYLPQGFPEEVFNGKQHLTITTMVLLDNYERNKAVSFMTKNLGKVIDDALNEYNLRKNQSYQFSIHGLDIMNDDPSDVRVLFGVVDDSSGFVQSLFNKINDAIKEFGYVADIRPKVKMHMTLMNTRYVPYKLSKQFKTFDASGILKDLKNFDFGKVDLKEIHLFVAGSKDELTKMYKSTHKINIF